VEQDEESLRLAVGRPLEVLERQLPARMARTSGRGVSTPSSRSRRCS
jgi:hypothetical protein